MAVVHHYVLEKVYLDKDEDIITETYLYLDENKVKEAFAIKREEVISEAADNYGVNRKDFNIEKYASKLVDTTSIFAYKSIEEETNVKVAIRVVVPDLYMKSK